MGTTPLCTNWPQEREGQGMKGQGVICLFCCGLIILFGTWCWADVKLASVTEEDCSKCHEDTSKHVYERGALHRDVGCLKCHEEHPPKGKNPIPSCDKCHDPGKTVHFGLKGCTTCHHPHYPLEMDLAKIGEVKAACLTCHSDQGREMEAHPSEHAGLDCKKCHMAHGEATQCMECHESHAQEMVYKDCLNCHKPHGPKAVQYDDKVPSNFCSCCHEDEGGALAKSNKAHHELSCAKCHESEHMTISGCESCHDAKPHGTFMHEKYPNCLDCHRDVHALAE